MLDRVIPARKEASIHLSSYSYIRAREEKGRKVGKVKEAEVEAELSRVVIIPPPSVEAKREESRSLNCSGPG